MPIPPDIAERLRCPRTGERLLCEGNRLCSGGYSYPVHQGVPILINEERSIFSVKAALQSGGRTPPTRLGRYLPDLSWNPRVHNRYRRFIQLLPPSDATVLLVGGGASGKGVEELSRSGVRVLSSDVYLEPSTDLVADAHDLPFEDGTFDGVVAQAVLEHVLDPFRCVSEMARVLKPSGVIYVETPFMQQVHAGRFDFYRFTHVGHRRLLRQFEERESGVAVGPASAFAWAYKHLLLSIFPSQGLRRLVTAWAHLTGAPLKYLDNWLSDSPAALDAASALYFIGTKTGTDLPDRTIVDSYRGADEANLDVVIKGSFGRAPPVKVPSDPPC